MRAAVLRPFVVTNRNIIFELLWQHKPSLQPRGLKVRGKHTLWGTTLFWGTAAIYASSQRVGFESAGQTCNVGRTSIWRLSYFAAEFGFAHVRYSR